MILIVEDDLEGKVGNFTDDLLKAGLNYECAETYEKAEKIFKEKRDEIEAIILDFAFPVSDKDFLEQDVKTKLPNGVKFINSIEFQLYLKQIPVVINTSCEKNLREKYLKKLKHLPQEGLIIYKATSEEHLSNCTLLIRRKIIEDIKRLNIKRQAIAEAPKAKRIFEKGKAGIRDDNGHFTYRENGG